jgi:hypothetical protein
LSLPGFRAMTEAPKTGYARLEGPDIFGIAMRGKLSAIGRANPRHAPSGSRTGNRTGHYGFRKTAMILAC